MGCLPLRPILFARDRTFFFLLLRPVQRTKFLGEVTVPVTFVVHHASSSSRSFVVHHGEIYARLDSNTLVTPRAIIPRTTSSGYTRQAAIHSLTSSSLATLRFRMAVHIWACDVSRARARARLPVRSLAVNVRTYVNAYVYVWCLTLYTKGTITAMCHCEVTRINLPGCSNDSF